MISLQVFTILTALIREIKDPVQQRIDKNKNRKYKERDQKEILLENFSIGQKTTDRWQQKLC